ncbi:MAG: membrane dipeptidase [Clostridia bacterium]|nr:membrane dipeptidase [Clostridia bacterium]
MNYFDLHCDTVTELYKRGETLATSSLHISAATVSLFEKYAQVFAVFSDRARSDEECYGDFFRVEEDFRSECGVSWCVKCDQLDDSGITAILSVEDARILAGDLSRLNRLYGRGVRVITPLWAGTTCIGGSFDTNEGLTEFGRVVVDECMKLGIIVDISHASELSARQMIEIASSYGSPVIASHSDSYTVHPHERNIKECEARRVASSGGVIGVCLHSPHLGCDKVNAETVFSHIEHLINIAGAASVCIGADFDGTDKLPHGFSSQTDILKIPEIMLRHNYPEQLIYDVMYNNAYRFFKKNLGVKRKVIK